MAACAGRSVSTLLATADSKCQFVRLLEPLESMMSVAGTWTLLMRTPMGDQRPTLLISEENGVLRGTMDNRGLDSVAITDITLDGDTLAWSTNVKSPFPLTLTFAVTIDGDTLTGTCKPGSFGALAVIGTRS